jgi:hypothetical protein
MVLSSLFVLMKSVVATACWVAPARSVHRLPVADSARWCLDSDQKTLHIKQTKFRAVSGDGCCVNSLVVTLDLFWERTLDALDFLRMDFTLLLTPITFLL